MPARCWHFSRRRRNSPHQSPARRPRRAIDRRGRALGALTGDEQDRAIAPAPPGRRKIVLATSIAETSITIEGVRMVVDGGLARVPRYEPDVGVTGSRRCGCRAPPPISAVAAPGEPSPASATGCGTSRRRQRWNPSPGRKSSPPICRPSRSISPPGRRPGPARLPRSAAESRAHRGQGAVVSSRHRRDGRITAKGSSAAPAAAAAARAHGDRCRRQR